MAGVRALIRILDLTYCSEKAISSHAMDASCRGNCAVLDYDLLSLAASASSTRPSAAAPRTRREPTYAMAAPSANGTPKKVSKFSVAKAATPQGAKRNVAETVVKGAAPEIPKASKVRRGPKPHPQGQGDQKYIHQDTGRR